MNNRKTFMDANEVKALVDLMADKVGSLLNARDITDPLMIGIRTGGVWLAEILHAQLGVSMEISANRPHRLQHVVGGIQIFFLHRPAPFSLLL